MNKKHTGLKFFIIFFFLLSTKAGLASIRVTYTQHLKVDTKNIHALDWHQQEKELYLLASASPGSIAISTFDFAQKTCCKKLTKKIAAGALSWHPTKPILTVATHKKITLLGYDYKKNKLSVFDTFDPKIGEITALTWHPTLRLYCCPVLACSVYQNYVHSIFLYLYDIDKKSFSLFQKIQENTVPETPVLAWRQKIHTLTCSSDLGIIKNRMFDNEKNTFEPLDTNRDNIPLFSSLNWHPTLPIILGTQTYSCSEKNYKNHGLSLLTYDYPSNTFNWLHTLNLLKTIDWSKITEPKDKELFLDICTPQIGVWLPKNNIDMLTFGSKKGTVSLWEVSGLKRALEIESNYRSITIDAAVGQDVHIQSTKTK